MNEKPSEECIKSVREWECSTTGHDFTVLNLWGDPNPYEIICSNCDKTWKIQND